MAEIRPVAEGFAVAPQVDAADFAAAAQAGFRTVIANRPDGEAPDQLSLADARAAAEAAGLSFVEIPFAGLPPSADIVDRTAAALAASAGPILAYCRTGTRSVTAWAYAQVKTAALSPDAAIAAGAGAGYDLAPHRAALEALAAR